MYVFKTYHSEQFQLNHDLHVGLDLSELGHGQSESLHALRLGDLK